MGQEREPGVKGRLLSIPVKAKYCLNCGYVLKFMLFEEEKARGEG
jgi:hypothetical protein